RSRTQCTYFADQATPVPLYRRLQASKVNFRKAGRQETRKQLADAAIQILLVSCIPAFLIFSWEALASQSGEIGKRYRMQTTSENLHVPPRFGPFAMRIARICPFVLCVLIRAYRRHPRLDSFWWRPEAALLFLSSIFHDQDMDIARPVDAGREFQ